MQLLYIATLSVICFEIVSCVMDGEVSKPGQWPFMAMIFNEISGHRCAGIVWNERTILTAAACLCIRKSIFHKYYVYLGNHKHLGWMNLDENYIFGIEKEMYFNTKIDGTCDGDYENIALFTLNRSIDFHGVHSKVRCVGEPVPLTVVDQNLCISVGYSGARLPPILDHVKTSIREQQSCSKTYGFYDANRHICAGDFKGKVTTHDLGGSLMCPIKGYPSQYKLVAISNVAKAAVEYYSNDDPAIYCVIDYYYYDWIVKNAGGVCTHI